MNKQKIMIVDDDPRNLRIALESLEDFSEKTTCSSGEEALIKIEDYQPDLLLLDIMMTGINGYEVTRRLRAHSKFKFLKIILVSGKAMIEEKLQGYECGADDYITKPFMSEELRAKCVVFLRLAKLEKGMYHLNELLETQVQEKTLELAETQTMLSSSSKMATLGEMAGDVAHEINNPLATISMLSYQIRRLVNDDPGKWQSKIVLESQRIDASIKHIADLVNGLNTYSRDGNLGAFDLVPLKPLIENTLNLARAKIKTNQVQLDVEAIDDQVCVYCQPVQIVQVFLNMISNSCDAIANLDSKWIRISTRQKEDGVEISFKDSGNGIPKEIRDKIFNPLFTTKGIGKGTGLGLSISKGIIRSHFGTLEINSESENTEFLIFLPNKKRT